MLEGCSNAVWGFKLFGVLVKGDRKDEAMDFYADASLGNDLAHDVVNKVAG
jgi:hypothetical protein